MASAFDHAADLYLAPDDGGPPRLVVGRCARCGAYGFPLRDVCSHCGPGPQVERLTLGGEGRVYASTLVHRPSPSGVAAPYGYGYVDLDAAPLRVFALFGREVREVLKPGAPVAMILEPLGAEDGSPLAYKFIPAEASP
jgi:uncharacterized OB-fold protein